MNNPIIIDQETNEILTTPIYVAGENVPVETTDDGRPTTDIRRGQRALMLPGEANIADIERQAYGAAVAIREWLDYNMANERVDLRDADKLIGFVQKIVDVRHPYDGMWAWSKLHVKSGRASANTIAEYRTETLDHLLWLLERGQSPIEVGLRDMESYRAFLMLDGSPLKMAEIRAKWLGAGNKRTPIGQYSATSAAKKLTVVRVFYNIACKREVMDSNPAAKIDLPKDPTSRESKVSNRTMAQHEMLLLAQSFNADDPGDIRDLAIVKLGYPMGLRVSEVEHLNLDDLDLNDIDVEKEKYGLLHIWHSKGGKDRHLAIPKKVRAALEKWLAIRNLMRVNNDALFVSMNWSESTDSHPGERLSKRGIQAMFDSRLKKLKIKRKGVGFHALRHLAGTQITLAGKSTKMLSMYLGHSSEATTSIYQNIAANQMENVAAAADW